MMGDSDSNVNIIDTDNQDSQNGWWLFTKIENGEMMSDNNEILEVYKYQGRDWEEVMTSSDRR